MPDRRWGGCIPPFSPWIHHCTRPLSSQSGARGVVTVSVDDELAAEWSVHERTYLFTTDYYNCDGVHAGCMLNEKYVICHIFSHQRELVDLYLVTVSWFCGFYVMILLLVFFIDLHVCFLVY